jgi:uroporphyrinogen-III synthase
VSSDDPYSPAKVLAGREANLLYFPVIQTLPPDSYDSLDLALQQAANGEIDWLLFTTPCAVEAVAERLQQLGIAKKIAKTLAKKSSKLHVAYFGAKTRITAAMLLPEWQSLVPDAPGHASFVEAMRLTARSRVAVPLAQRSRANWRELIAAGGATVLEAPAYRLLLGRGGDDVPGLLWGGLVDAIVFLTENSIRHFSVRLKAEGGTLDMLRDVVVAALDPQTAAAAQAFGLNAQVVPEQATYEMLADSLAGHFSTQPVAT